MMLVKTTDDAPTMAPSEGNLDGLGAHRHGPHTAQPRARHSTMIRPPLKLHWADIE